MADDQYGPSIPLTRLYERTSRKGTKYLAGRLGLASVFIFKTDDVSDDGQPIWRVVLQEPPQRQGQGNSQNRDRRQSKPDRDWQAPTRDQDRRVVREDTYADSDIPF